MKIFYHSVIPSTSVTRRVYFYFIDKILNSAWRIIFVILAVTKKHIKKFIACIVNKKSAENPQID
ncbi:hypothetical protein WA1_18590 [Scytonema hofmannii PCC 7110]|uniref:Uncharacterized protein n=1 Tax=Scytonema hofmannii PCC 7110 TaxID=128403 RepID=A0A139XBD9_9CYAN|nr:hypothetical protein WA1_18590 [Scytonema hofmannii PCC 7110]